MNRKKSDKLNRPSASLVRASGRVHSTPFPGEVRPGSRGRNTRPWGSIYPACVPRPWPKPRVHTQALPNTRRNRFDKGRKGMCKFAAGVYSGWPPSVSSRTHGLENRSARSKIAPQRPSGALAGPGGALVARRGLACPGRTIPHAMQALSSLPSLQGSRPTRPRGPLWPSRPKCFACR